MSAPDSDSGASGASGLGEKCPRCGHYGFTCERDGRDTCEARGRVRALGADVRRRVAGLRVEASVGLLAALREVRRVRAAYDAATGLDRRVALDRAVRVLACDLLGELEDVLDAPDHELDDLVGDVCMQKVDGPAGEGRGVFYWRPRLRPGHSYCGRSKAPDAEVCGYCETERRQGESGDLDQPVPFALAGAADGTVAP